MYINGTAIAGVIPEKSIDIASWIFGDGEVHTCKVTRIAPEDFHENSITNIHVCVLS